MVKSPGPSGEGKHSSPTWGGSQSTTSALSLLITTSLGKGAVWHGDIWGCLSSSSSGAECWAGQAGCTVTIWLLMNFRNNHSLLPLSKQTQGEVRRCKYNIQCNRTLPLAWANTLQLPVNMFLNNTVHGFGLGYSWRAACFSITRVLAGKFYLWIRESFW